ncbi:MAG TPA: hypothetical protein VGT44_03000 [Ktedonobacteraceae bacterium]|nr:hypothetical protein [Ktedonobacteraceae bacterium]
MITQRIKNWLRQVFSWWPSRRQASPVEYRHDSGALSVVAPSEGVSLSALEGTTPQTSATNTTGAATPFLSTTEERPAYTALTPSPANDEPAAPHLPGSPADIVPASGEAVALTAHIPPAPTPQQRLEFLRYLVKRGIVNEGKEE